MFGLPRRVPEFNLADQALAVVAGGNRDPLGAGTGLDAVAVAPVVLGVLNVVVEDEKIDVVNDVEVTLPRDVVRLQHSDPSPG